MLRLCRRVVAMLRSPLPWCEVAGHSRDTDREGGTVEETSRRADSDCQLYPECTGSLKRGSLRHPRWELPGSLAVTFVTMRCRHGRAQQSHPVGCTLPREPDAAPFGRAWVLHAPARRDLSIPSRPSVCSMIVLLDERGWCVSEYDSGGLARRWTACAGRLGISFTTPLRCEQPSVEH